MIIQLNPTIAVLTPNGEGEAMFIFDYGLNCNQVFLVRHDGGKLLNYYLEQIKVFDNPMNEKGWNIEPFEAIKKLPKGAKRNTDFLKKK